MFEAFIVALASVWADSGFSALTSGNVIMIVVGLVLLYMAIGKGFEPLLSVLSAVLTARQLFIWQLKWLLSC